MESQTTTFPAAPASALAGLLTRAELARDLKKNERTVLRWEHQGLPVIRIGLARLYDVAAVRVWIVSQVSRREEPRRGRPTNQNAP